ncbi:hypothetical protein ACODEX_002968 [Listeria monocytogenes]
MKMANTPEDLTSESITFKITGDDMVKETGYSLDKVLESLTSFENLVNKTYLHFNNKKRFTKEDREQLTIKINEVKEGSFLTVLSVIYTSTLIPLVPIAIDHGPVIMKSIKHVYDFLKIKATADKEGKKMEINQTPASGAVAVVNNADNTVTNIIIVNAPEGIPELAKTLAAPIKKMSDSIDGESVKSISNSSDEEITITHTERELFSSNTMITEEPISILGKIVSGNYRNQTGNIEITECADKRIEAGESYSFQVEGDLRAEEKWKEMFLDVKPYYCKLRISYDMTKDNPYSVQQIIITDWDRENWEQEEDEE